MTLSRKELWGLGRAGEACGLSSKTLGNIVRAHDDLARRWGARKIGGRWYVDANRFAAWIDAIDASATAP